MQVDNDVVKAIAKAADADEQTVLKRLVGIAVRGRVALRVDREIERHRLTVGRPTSKGGRNA